MIDINDTKQIEKLKRAAQNPSGQLIVSFLEQQLGELDFEKINDDKSDELAGQDFKVVLKTRKFIKNIISLLTP